MKSVWNNSFLGSFDPFHISHLHTRKQAEREIGETDIVICRNWLKSDGWLSLEDRKKDIIYTLLLDPDFDDQKRDPEQIVKIAKDNESILSVIYTSDKIVRWVRSQEDISYVYKLLGYYWVEWVEDKWHLIRVLDYLKDISSTKNKIILQEYIRETDYIPRIYRNIFWVDVYKKLKASNFDSTISENTRKTILENITTYFTKLDSLYFW